MITIIIHFSAWTDLLKRTLPLRLKASPIGCICYNRCEKTFAHNIQ